MNKKAALPAIAVVLAASMALAGCSPGSSDPKSAGPTSSQQAGDPDDEIGPPGAAVPGEEGEEGEDGDEDEDAEAATINPDYANGEPNTSLQIAGFSADVNVLELPSTPATKAPWTEMPKPHPIKDADGAQTEAVQGAAPAGAAPPIDVNVAGLDYDTWGAGHPPDTSGAVGPDQYVQTVNTSIGIYAKSGEQLNAFTYNTFFGQFHSGTPCDNQNGGDPQVIFDQPSNKWIIGDLAYPRPYYFCMAVSDGPDLATANWTLYPYLASQTELNDYPKIASGPNGLFLTSNMFLNEQYFDGAQVWALKRSSLGQKKLKVQTVRTGSSYGSLLPANSYAATESKGPDYLVSLESSTTIGLWQYSVNWKHPKKTKFTTTPKLIKVASYQPAGSVPEKNGSALDSLSDRPMYQLQLATDGTLWFNHSVQVGSQAGVRWYQLGNIAGASPTVLQQSTYAPGDSLYRWMGSLAVDKDGNMAVGFSTSSSSAFPSINYATRLATDPASQLTAEANIVKGTGAQTVTNRWGDYSQMSLDPTDSCTFWYTQEYYTETGGDWQTRIASFKFPSCS